MRQLTEKDFSYIKEEIQDGRLSPGGIRTFLVGAFVFSIFTVGIGYFGGAYSDSVGWDNLSIIWQTIFKLEAVLFAIHLLILLFCYGKSNITQIILNFSMVFFSYKMVLDPFLFLFMSYKNDGVYDTYAPTTFFIIGLGMVIHIFLVVKQFYDLKAEKVKRKAKKQTKKSLVLLGLLFFLVTLTGYAVKNNLLDDSESLFFLIVASVLYFAVLIGSVDFVLGAYCLVRFPSFRVNPPIVRTRRNNKKRKKKRRKKK